MSGESKEPDWAELSEIFRRDAEDGFHRALEAAWSVTRDNAGEPNAEYIVLARVLPSLRGLVYCRQWLMNITIDDELKRKQNRE